MFGNAEEGFRDAFQDALEGIIAGALISTTLEVIKTMPYVPSYYPSMLQLIEVTMLVGSIFLVFQIESWKFIYLLGWIFAMWILYSVRLVEPWLLILYATVGIPVLIIRALKKIGL